MTRRSSRQGGSARDYPRTARLNRLIQEIVADALEAVDDDRLELVTVTEVKTDPDLRHAIVFFDSLQGEEGDDEVLEGLGEARLKLQAAIGREARIKRTPTLAFRPDPAVRSGERIEEILRDIIPEHDSAADATEAPPADLAVDPAPGPVTDPAVDGA